MVDELITLRRSELDAYVAAALAEHTDPRLDEALALLAKLFDAFDGKNIEQLIGHYAHDHAPATIGGLASFTVAWDEQAAEMIDLLRKPWDELSKDEKIMRGTWSAQHAFVKRLGDLRRQYDALLQKAGN